MSLRRITQSFAAAAVAGLLAGSTYVAGASTAVGAAHHGTARHVHDAGFVAPVPHKYGANGMRMGLHCETSDIS